MGALFNGKIVPQVPDTVRGRIWYQGEENELQLWFRDEAPIPQAQLHINHLQLLVNDWRELWGNPDLPLAWVQLPNYADGRSDADWPTVREALRRSLTLPQRA